SFRGLSREIWLLALVSLINRAGTMVIPFLTIYLKTDKNFSLQDIAWVMTAFGLGSISGSWIGGKLSKTLGFYKIMFWSLFLSGIAFILLQFLDSFKAICFGIFFLMLIADTFRPATYVAIDTYSSSENKTRSLSLIRLAINLGFSFGPALGGLIITSWSYSGLFWIDGLTCICAAFVFISLLKNKTPLYKKDEEKDIKQLSPYKDFPYLLLIFIVFLVGFTFLQFFSTIPLFYKEVHHLDEQKIGMLFFLNGFLIFLIEMPIVKYIEKPTISIYKVIHISFILLAFGFLIVNFFSWVGILIISMVFLTLGEILNFPFMNNLALKRANGGNIGEYMGLYTMAFSLAHVLGHNTGLQLIRILGYPITWFIMAGILGICIFLLIWYKKIVEREKLNLE
ncbi:MAG: MFS transporter, partial [Bacteroidota bacterium]